MWTIPQTGPVAFAELALSAGDIDGKVKLLREAFETEAPAVEDIPAST